MPNKSNNNLSKLKFFIHPSKDSEYSVGAWEIEGETDSVDETARISLETSDFSYSIYLDSNGKPYLNVWNKQNDEIHTELINESIADIGTCIHNCSNRHY